MPSGTLNLGRNRPRAVGLVRPNWLIFHDPFTFLAFFVFFTVATASCKRAPFDLAEAESELVAGFHTEYSGMRWSFFFMAEYASMFVVSGDRIDPVPRRLVHGHWADWIRPLASDAGVRRSNRQLRVGRVISRTCSEHGDCCQSRASLLVFVQIWVRWTLPRLRIDQVMMTCLKYLVPISCFLFLGATLWPLRADA